MDATVDSRAKMKLDMKPETIKVYKSLSYNRISAVHGTKFLLV